jgi:hypothetical protein
MLTVSIPLDAVRQLLHDALAGPADAPGGSHTSGPPAGRPAASAAGVNTVGVSTPPARARPGGPTNAPAQSTGAANRAGSSAPPGTATRPEPPAGDVNPLGRSAPPGGAAEEPEPTPGRSPTRGRRARSK